MRDLKIFFLLGFILYPLDSLPFFNVGVYRPLWLIPITLPILFCFRRKVNIGLVNYFIVLLYGYLISLLTVGFDLTVIAITLLCFSSVYTLTYFFRYNISLYGSNVFYNEILPKYVLIGSIFPSLIGIIYVISPSIGEVIESLFSHRDYPSRMQLVSGEPSWAAKYIVVWLGASFYVIKKPKITLIVNSIFCIFILYTGSTLGMILAFLFLIYKYSDKILSIMLFLLITAILILFVNHFEMLGEYASKRISNITSLVVSPIEYISYSGDRSLLIRIISPMVGLFMFWQSYGLGFGLESSEVVYGNILKSVFDLFSISMDYDYFMLGGVSTKNIYLKILGELGILGLISLACIIKKTMSMNSGYAKDFVVISLLLGLNSDGYAYFPFLVSLAIIFSYNSKVSVKKNKVR